jgi:hypothetical protein
VFWGAALVGSCARVCYCGERVCGCRGALKLLCVWAGWGRNSPAACRLVVCMAACGLCSCVHQRIGSTLGGLVLKCSLHRDAGGPENTP